MQKIGRAALGIVLLLVIATAALSVHAETTMLLFPADFIGTPYGGLPDGVFSMRFAIYDASSGGNRLWPAVAEYEEHPSITAIGGGFSVVLGSSGQPLTEAVFQAPAPYVQISVCQPAGTACSGFEPVPVRLPAGTDIPTTTTPSATPSMGSIFPDSVDTHDHWGETWDGTTFGLRFSNVGSYSSLVSLADHGNGLLVEEASGHGVRIENATLSGLSIRLAGLDGISIGEVAFDGISIGDVGANGLKVWNVGNSPVRIFPDDAGFSITESGVTVGGSIGFGLWIGWAGEDGVHVNSALGYGVYARSQNSHAMAADGPVLIGERTRKQIALLKWYEASRVNREIECSFKGLSSGFIAVTLHIKYPSALAFDGEDIYIGGNDGESSSMTIGRIGRNITARDFYGSHISSFSDIVAMTFDGLRIWALGSCGWGTMCLANLFSQYEYTRTQYSLPGFNPTGLAFDGEFIWVSALDGLTRVQVLDDYSMIDKRATDFRCSAVAYDGEHIWVTEPETGTVSVVSRYDLHRLEAYNVGQNPDALAFDGANMWVANYDDGTVSKLRVADGYLVGTYAVGRSPTAIVFDGFHIWVANEGSNTVTKLRAIDGAEIGTYAVGRSPRALIFDGAYVWVANYENSTLSKL